MAMSMCGNSPAKRTTLHLRSSFLSSPPAQLLLFPGIHYHPPPSSAIAITNSTLQEPLLVPRRCFLHLLSATPLLLGAPSNASPTLNPKPSFLRSFGLGDADLYYPRYPFSLLLIIPLTLISNSTPHFFVLLAASLRAHGIVSPPSPPWKRPRAKRKLIAGAWNSRASSWASR